MQLGTAAPIQKESGVEDVWNVERETLRNVTFFILVCRKANGTELTFNLPACLANNDDVKREEQKNQASMANIYSGRHSS